MFSVVVTSECPNLCCATLISIPLAIIREALEKINAVLQMAEYLSWHVLFVVLKSLSCAEFENHGIILLNKIAMGTVAPMASEE